MPSLTEQQKLFVVQRLACYRTFTQTAEDVKEEFGIEVTRQQCRSYYPPQYKVARKWRELFDATRAAYLTDITSIGVSQPAYRLSILQRQLDDALSKKKQTNPVEVRAILEQAAKEVGGAFTNARVISARLGITIDDLLRDAGEDDDRGD